MIVQSIAAGCITHLPFSNHSGPTWPPIGRRLRPGARVRANLPRERRFHPERTPLELLSMAASRVVITIRRANNRCRRRPGTCRWPCAAPRRSGTGVLRDPAECPRYRRADGNRAAKVQRIGHDSFRRCAQRAQDLGFALAVGRAVSMQDIVEPDRWLTEHVRLLPRAPGQIRLRLALDEAPV